MIKNFKIFELYEDYLDTLKIELNICDITENDEYYIIYLKYFFIGKIDILDNILRGKNVRFECEYHPGTYSTIYTNHKYEEIVIKNVNLYHGLIIFVDTKNEEHLVNKNSRIFISKLHMNTYKYNL